LTAWLEPYVKDNWKVTAFKIVQDPKTGQGARTAPVRMSFPAERPFFPYREPPETKPKDDKAAPAPPRLLRVYFVGDRRMAGRWGGARAAAGHHPRGGARPHPAGPDRRRDRAGGIPGEAVPPGQSGLSAVGRVAGAERERSPGRVLAGASLLSAPATRG